MSNVRQRPTAAPTGAVIQQQVGLATTYSFQKSWADRLTVDGIVGPQTWYWLRQL
ncbi:MULTISPECIES: peptidoglycan-binding domain-containing protein [Streptomyces]|uniref:Peptidoglycan binding-like domain-containing protein n=1 Tax=Streptomyces sp. NBC_00093 TaxID=2975649 RepID=A0AAU2AFA7_9ACTN